MRVSLFNGLLLTFLLASCVPALAQSSQSPAASQGSPGGAPAVSPLSIEIAPAFDLPLSDSAQYFSGAGTIALGMDYQILKSIVYVLAGGEYSYMPTKGTSTLSVAGARIGAGVLVPLTSWLGLLGYGYGGYYYTTTNDFSVSASDPFAGVGAGVQFSFSPIFALQVGAQYKYYLGLWQGLSADIGTRIALGRAARGSGAIQQPATPTPAVKPLAAPQNPATQPQVEFIPSFPSAFPVFYKYYDDHPIGTLRVNNRLGVPISNIKVQFYIKHYMDEPKEVEAADTLAPQSSAELNVFALFTDDVLNITEGTKAAAELVISYMANGQTAEEKKIVTVEFLGRNAMTWDDNRKAAAYVTAKDPGVLQFARSVTSQVRSWETRSINENLQAAIALHEALDLYGLDYVPNPITPYSETSKKKDVVDFLQFPRETFQYKAGDCSDISILYSALLQAVGIDTAFITIPGHIFLAVNTGISPQQAEAALIPSSEYVAYQGKAWVPVEITMRHQGFWKAWELGAKEWNENNPSGQAGFYPVQEAWKAYQPVGLPGISPIVATPSTDQVLTAYKVEAQKYLDVAIAPQVAQLQAEIQSSEKLGAENEGLSGLAAKNKLGVLYAKCGNLDKAEGLFKEILARRTYLPALLNMGNLHFVRNDCKSALGYYQQASKLDPRNPQRGVFTSRHLMIVVDGAPSF